MTETKPRFSGTVRRISPFGGHAIVELDENEFRISYAQCGSVSKMVPNKGLRALFRAKRDLKAGDRISGEIKSDDFPQLEAIDKQLPLPSPIMNPNQNKLPKLTAVLAI